MELQPKFFKVLCSGPILRFGTAGHGRKHTKPHILNTHLASLLLLFYGPSGFDAALPSDVQNATCLPRAAGAVTASLESQGEYEAPRQGELGRRSLWPLGNHRQEIFACRPRSVSPSSVTWQRQCRRVVAKENARDLSTASPGSGNVRLWHVVAHRGWNEVSLGVDGFRPTSTNPSTLWTLLATP